MNTLLCINVNKQPTDPVNDYITAKVSKLLRESAEDESTRIRGVIRCPACGYMEEGYATNCSRILFDGTQMSVLGLHFVRDHRNEISNDELLSVTKLML